MPRSCFCFLLGFTLISRAAVYAQEFPGDEKPDLIKEIQIAVLANEASVKEKSDPNDMIERLNTQLTLIDEISPWVEKPQLPRLALLRACSENTLTAVKAAPQKFTTIQRYRDLVRKYRSPAYYDDIDAEVITLRIRKLVTQAEEIALITGYDEFSGNSQETKSTFEHIESLLDQLATKTNSEALRAQLDEVKLTVSHASSFEKDDDETYQKAVPACKALRKLYPEFHKIRSGEPAYKVTQEIEGATEYYIREFANIDAKVRAND